jgi:hypothetical protein
MWYVKVISRPAKQLLRTVSTVVRVAFRRYLRTLYNMCYLMCDQYQISVDYECTKRLVVGDGRWTSIVWKEKTIRNEVIVLSHDRKQQKNELHPLRTNHPRFDLLSRSFIVDPVLLVQSWSDHCHDGHGRPFLHSKLWTMQK